MARLRVKAWGATDAGRRRSRNEDAFGIVEQDGVLVVADGMGGHRGGSVASRMAVDTVVSTFRKAHGDYEGALRREQDDRARFGTTEPMRTITTQLEAEDTPAVPEPDSASAFPYSSALALLRLAARQAAAEIYSTSRADPDLSGMGTTLTAAVLEGHRLYVAHAGDSRCYLWREGVLRQLTDDHSWIAEQVRAGAISEKEAKLSRFRHVITRSIGFERHADLEVRSAEVTAGDRLLLCSDGLYGLVSDDDLTKALGGEPAELPARLIAMANERGGDDNITAVVALLSGAG